MEEENVFLRSGSFCRYHCQEFPLRSFLNRLTSFISALISSSVNSGVSPLSADAYMFRWLNISIGFDVKNIYD